MFTVILAALVATVLAGLAVRRILEIRQADARISRRELYIGLATAPFIAVLVAFAGWAIARNNLITFTEYWNGWETSAVKTQITCTRDGPCRWEYNCDPYLCNPHPCNCVCTSRDKNGSCTSESCSTCYDTCYHDCPYVTHEYNYDVHTTLGPVNIASYVFPPNPDSHRWRSGIRVPDGTIRSAGVGDPPFWVAAKNRCDANRPGPVTKRNSYSNYVLASDHTLMKEHSGDIADYQARKLLPPLARSVQAFYHADKVSFVGWTPPNRLVWSEALEYLNGNFGMQLQGDLHLVVIKDDMVAANPERYAFALKAYWQDKAAFGQDALSKNATVVIVGTTDGVTVSWSRAFTGMPLGNETLIVTLRDGLKGQPLTPEGLIGPGRSARDTTGVRHPPSDVSPTLLQRALWGAENPATKFTRVSMSGKDGKGGFLYLKNEIRPTTGQMWGIFVMTLLLSCGVWVWAALHYDSGEHGEGFRGRRRY